MKYFCSKCGKNTQYSFEQPKFCASCGNSFNSKLTSNYKPEIIKNELKLNSQTQPPLQKPSAPEEYVPNIDFKSIKAKFTVDMYKPKADTFGDLIDNPSKEPEKFKSNLENIPKQSEAEVMAEFRREAGSLRESS